MNALILVDIQNDFLPGGALAVAHGDEVVAVCNAVQAQYDVVVATQDWHPKGHESFASSHPGCQVGEVIDLHGLSQVLWPDHCVQGTRGAEFPGTLHVSRLKRVFPKGTDKTIDSYSGFFDNGHKKSTGMGEYLKESGVTDVAVLGLATDYCVKFTALDARGAGFRTTLIQDGCRGVELHPGDIARAIDEMRMQGVIVATSSQQT